MSRTGEGEPALRLSCCRAAPRCVDAAHIRHAAMPVTGNVQQQPQSGDAVVRRNHCHTRLYTVRHVRVRSVQRAQR